MMPMRAHVSITPAECNLKKDIDVEDRPGTECLAGQSASQDRLPRRTESTAPSGRRYYSDAGVRCCPPSPK